MEKGREIRPVALIRTDFKEKFGIPRQSGRAPSLLAKIVFLPEFRHEEALKEIDGFSHLWLIFDFSEIEVAEFSPTVRPPRLGGNKRVGVFASRSPFRPNRLGLSCVKLEEIKRTEKEGVVLIVSGADLLDGTPIFDIKPYLPFCDCKIEATGGYAEKEKDYKLIVSFDESLLNKLPQDKRASVLECLAEDPRPSYQRDPKRKYGMSFAGYEIKFTVEENLLTVLNVEKI